MDLLQVDLVTKQLGILVALWGHLVVVEFCWRATVGGVGWLGRSGLELCCIMLHPFSLLAMAKEHQRAAN